jgi:Flp pilus assembly protein TadG
MTMDATATRAERRTLRRLGRDEKGIAAVEFALILPLMVTLYVGSIQVTQGVLASRKMAMLSRTLSDIVAQQPTATTTPCSSAGLCDSAMSLIFDAATAVMSPFDTGYLQSTATANSTTTLTMTVTSVEFTEYTAAPTDATLKPYIYIPNTGQLATATDPTSTNKGYLAKARWSKAAASPKNGPLRSCTTALTPVDNTASTSATSLPKGLYASGAVVIADVTYKYEPMFGGSVISLATTDGAGYIAMSNTTYMRPRNWTTYITYNGGTAGTTFCTQ